MQNQTFKFLEVQTQKLKAEAKGGRVGIVYQKDVDTRF